METSIGRPKNRFLRQQPTRQVEPKSAGHPFGETFAGERRADLRAGGGSMGSLPRATPRKAWFGCELALKRATTVRSLSTPIRVPTFRHLLVADVLSDIGTFMQSVGAAWLMVSPGVGPALVAFTQTASTLPFFFLAACVLTIR